MFSAFDQLFSAGADILFEQLGVQKDRFRVRIRYLLDYRWTEWDDVELISLPESRLDEANDFGRERVRNMEIHIRNKCVRLSGDPGIEAEVELGGTVWAVDEITSLSPNIISLMLTRPEVIQRYAPTRGVA